MLRCCSYKYLNGKSVLLVWFTACNTKVVLQRKFRDMGNKEGAVAAIRLLEESGLCEVREERASRGTAKVNIIIVMYKSHL